MALFDVISEDIKKAMIAKDKVALEALRGVKKEFLEAKTAKGASGELADDAALKILQKMVKQRKESAQIFTEQNRPELAQNELAEAAVIEKYLPAKLSDAELEAEIRTLKRLEKMANDVRVSGVDRKWDELSHLLQDNQNHLHYKIYQ